MCLENAQKGALPATNMTPEQDAVLRSVRKLIDFWQITQDELGEDLRPIVRPVAPPPKAAPTIKYRHPITGITWDGEGGQPAWLREALTREGFTVDELRAVGPET
jgi:DNA-binding protein H-NS